MAGGEEEGEEQGLMIWLVATDFGLLFLLLQRMSVSASGSSEVFWDRDGTLREKDTTRGMRSCFV